VGGGEKGEELEQEAQDLEVLVAMVETEKAREALKRK